LQDKQENSRRPETCWCKQTHDQLLLLLLLALCHKRIFVVSNNKEGTSSAVVLAKPLYSMLHFLRTVLRSCQPWHTLQIVAAAHMI
jgi:hypothetical protein